MNASEKLNLNNLIKEYKHESTTEKIRTLKHSNLIREDVAKMIELKKKYIRIDNKILKGMVEKQCSFLYTNYTNIFNKVFKGVIDLNLLNNFLKILKTVEDGKCDQHEASYKVGQILKQIYIDSAVKQGDNLDKERVNEDQVEKNVGKTISYKEYKKLQNKN